MTRYTLLDLLGTRQISGETERQFVDYCLWEQAVKACVAILEQTGMTPLAQELAAAQDTTALLITAHRVARQARRAGLGVMPLAAVQGMAAELEQLIHAARPGELDSDAVSFHAARLAGWAGWVRSSFRTGVFKSNAEDAAYAEQLQRLMRLMGVAGV